MASRRLSRLSVLVSVTGPLCFGAGFLLGERPETLHLPPASVAHPGPLVVNAAPLMFKTIAPGELPVDEAAVVAPKSETVVPAPAPAPSAGAPIQFVAPPLPVPPADPIAATLNTSGEAAKRAALFYDLAEACKHKEFKGEARQFALAGLALDPANGSLLDLLAELEPGAQRAYLEAALAHSPDDTDMWRRLRDADPAAALDRVQEALRERPTDGMLLDLLLTYDEAAGLIGLRTALAIAPDDHTLLQLLVQREPETATPMLESQLRSEPDSWTLLQLLVEANPARATPWIEAAMATMEDEVERSDMIRLLAEADPARGLEAYAALPEASTDPDLLSEIAHAHLQVGQLDQGLILARQVIDSERERDGSSYFLSSLLDESNEAGLQIAWRLLQESPGDADLQNSILWAYYEAGRVGELEGTASAWIAEATSSTVANRLGSALNEVEQTELATRAFRRAFRLEPTNTSPIDELLEVNASAGLELIAERLRASPRDGRMRYFMRCGLENLSDYEPGKVVEGLNRFTGQPLSVDPEFLTDLAERCAESDEPEATSSARTLARRAEAIDPGGSEMRTEFLRSLR